MKLLDSPGRRKLETNFLESFKGKVKLVVDFSTSKIIEYLMTLFDCDINSISMLSKNVNKIVNFKRYVNVCTQFGGDDAGRTPGKEQCFCTLQPSAPFPAYSLT